jgi:argininosuccinate synthase
MAKKRGKVKRVVLAYSGGLDTSVIVRWLIENYGCEVICFSADLGQGEDLRPLRKKAIATGAKKIIIKDLREEFVRDFVIPAIKANALYEGKYPMATSLGRPLIAKWLIQIAHEERADAIAHGCTGKGNDQVRFELTAFALDPDIKVIAPVREWELKTRDEEIEYAQKHKIPVEATKKKPYSIDANLYGVAIECGVLEDPWVAPPEEAYRITRSPERAPNKPQHVEVSFEQGTPTKLNGKKMSAVKIIEALNKIGGAHGVGRIDLVENRIVGIKSREVYEAPAATILIAAHQEIESLTLERELMHMKESIVPRYAELIYNGQWYSPMRDALAAFVEATQKHVTGDVRLKLYKGQCTPVGRRSPYSIYRKDLATYDKGDVFDHQASVGFINIYGLPLKVICRVQSRPRSE